MTQELLETFKNIKGTFDEKAFNIITDYFSSDTRYLGLCFAFEEKMQKYIDENFPYFILTYHLDCSNETFVYKIKFDRYDVEVEFEFQTIFNLALFRRMKGSKECTYLNF